ncbi:hypothetical protein RB195_005160 [Necator americanus]|uniref:Uncharacterized protein n=1 Tax=Necator americanus TaxID=51031 RepID=A0ABR1BQL3_NECAM
MASAERHFIAFKRRLLSQQEKSVANNRAPLSTQHDLNADSWIQPSSSMLRASHSKAHGNKREKRSAEWRRRRKVHIIRAAPLFNNDGTGKSMFSDPISR